MQTQFLFYFIMWLKLVILLKFDPCLIQSSVSLNEQTLYYKWWIQIISYAPTSCPPTQVFYFVYVCWVLVDHCCTLQEYRRYPYTLTNKIVKAVRPKFFLHPPPRFIAISLHEASPSYTVHVMHTTVCSVTCYGCMGVWLRYDRYDSQVSLSMIMI